MNNLGCGPLISHYVNCRDVHSLHENAALHAACASGWDKIVELIVVAEGGKKSLAAKGDNY